MFAFHVTLQSNVPGILADGLLARGPLHPLSPYHEYEKLHDQPVGVYFTVDDNWQMWRWERDHADAMVLIVCEIEERQLLPDPEYPCSGCLAFYCPDNVNSENIVAIIELGSTALPREQEDIERDLVPFPRRPIVHDELELV